VALADPAGPDRVALADPDRVAPANREAPVDLEAPAVPEDLAGREDTSRAARAGTADMGRVAPANRVGRAALVGMSPVIQADRVAPANLVGMTAVVQADRVALADQDPGQNRALLDRNPVHLRRRLPDPTRAHPHRMRARPHPHLTRAHPHRTRAHPHRTPARPQEQTHPEVATHRPVLIHPAEETHLAEVIRPVEATHPAEEATHEADTEGVTLHYRREFSSQSDGFENAATNCIGAQLNSWEGQHEDRARLCCSGRGGRIGIIRFGRRDGGSSAAGPLPAMVPR
jgi:hypothetical protein